MNKTKTYFDKWQEPNEFTEYQFTEPSKENIKNIRIGDSVKVDNKFERFWVKIIKFKDNAIFGEVDNNLVIKRGYNYKDIIVFGKQHIFDILTKELKGKIRYKIKSKQ